MSDGAWRERYGERLVNGEAMLRVFHHSGLPVESRLEEGVYRL